MFAIEWYCSQSKYVPRVAQCLFPRPNWDPPLPQASVYPPPPPPRGHTRLLVKGGGSKFGRLEKKPSSLSTVLLLLLNALKKPIAKETLFCQKKGNILKCFWSFLEIES